MLTWSHGQVTEPRPRTESSGPPAFTGGRRIALPVTAAATAASFRVAPRPENSKVATARSGGTERVAVAVVRTCARYALLVRREPGVERLHGRVETRPGELDVPLGALGEVSRQVLDLRRMAPLVLADEQHPLIQVQRPEQRMRPDDLAQREAIPRGQRLQ